MDTVPQPPPRLCQMPPPHAAIAASVDPNDHYHFALWLPLNSYLSLYTSKLLKADSCSLSYTHVLQPLPIPL